VGRKSQQGSRHKQGGGKLISSLEVSTRENLMLRTGSMCRIVCSKIRSQRKDATHRNSIAIAWYWGISEGWSIPVADGYSIAEITLRRSNQQSSFGHVALFDQSTKGAMVAVAADPFFLLLL
jgi:hypothetical protein